MNKYLAKLKSLILIAVTDFAHWTRAIGLCLFSAVVQVLQGGVNLEQMMVWNIRTWGWHVAATFAPMLLALSKGERNDDGPAIAAKLSAAGYVVNPPAPPSGPATS